MRLIINRGFDVNGFSNWFVENLGWFYGQYLVAILLMAPSTNWILIKCVKLNYGVE